MKSWHPLCCCSDAFSAAPNTPKHLARSRVGSDEKAFGEEGRTALWRSCERRFLGRTGNFKPADFREYHFAADTLQCDVLVIDGPAGLSEVTRAVLLVANLALLPCGPSVLDLRAVQEAIRVVGQAQRIRGGPPQAVLVPNKLQVQYRLTREMLATVQSLGVPVLGGLRLRQAFADAAGQGTLVWRLGPRGLAATEEITHLFEELSIHESQANHEPSVARE